MPFFIRMIATEFYRILPALRDESRNFGQWLINMTESLGSMEETVSRKDFDLSALILFLPRKNGQGDRRRTI
ncbi:hypothetical protein [Mesorhizobium sp. M00.F.Ca.ET.220.01.1.1]|uniref:hypothetical protein n=1 Tax=Mesorhizobium sp. M00.F.Ca.ET.220.01.1.1 TaxID=2500531 RepID=UPI000FD34A8A|nr:hypothetical protein [Mesorhizobium sp. M00.F.Ca.ET.220.01.1.1]TGP27959.1 hypothetical protein EN875_032895 [Mesorhizobium sp. M2D.F.Ca.ET.232.01.1.1]